MSLLLAAVVVATFCLTVVRMGLVLRAREVFTRAEDCLKVLRDNSLDDRSKERVLRSQSLQLFRLFGVIAGGAVLGLLVPLAGVWIGEMAGIASVEGVLSVLGRADFLAATILIGAVAYLLQSGFGRR